MPKLPDALQARAVEYLRSVLTPNEIDYLRKFHERCPNWQGDETTDEEQAEMQAKYGFCVPVPFHFSSGMQVRNLLRDVIKDSELPPVRYEEDGFDAQNWDDYYAAVLDEVVAD